MSHGTKMNMPTLRYFGGKWKIASQIIPSMPPHDMYVEPFGGSAAVLLQKRRVKKEVYNDLDAHVVNFFRQVRQDADRLAKLLLLTPYAKEEYEFACTMDDCDPLESARRFFVRSWMGVGGEGIKHKSGFRRSYVPDIVPEQNYVRSVALIGELAKRLQGVVIENRPAAEIIQMYDCKEVLFFCDPPYMIDTRTGSQRYRCEMSGQEHAAFLESLQSCVGSVVLTHYHNELYQDSLRGWKRSSIKTNTTGQKPRMEMIYTKESTPTLFTT